MAALRRATGLAFALAFVVGGWTGAAAEERPAPGAGFFDAAALDDPAFGRCAWMGRSPPFVFQESDYIRGYFEPTNLAAYQQALPRPFGMPARPLIRIGFLDFYDMASGPTYLETEVAILGMDGTQPGWVVLTLPVTNGPACIGGRDLFGLAKVMRRISFVRAADRYTGTLYTRGAEKVDFTLTVTCRRAGCRGARAAAPERRLPAIRAAERKGAAVRRLRHAALRACRARRLPDQAGHGAARRLARSHQPGEPPRRRRPAGRALVADQGQVFDQAALGWEGPPSYAFFGV